MCTVGFLVISALIVFFGFLVYDVAQPSPDNVHKLGPIYWVTKRHNFTTESVSVVDDRPVEQHVYFGIYTAQTDHAKVITIQFLFWDLSFGTQR